MSVRSARKRPPLTRRLLLCPGFFSAKCRCNFISSERVNSAEQRRASPQVDCCTHR